MATRTVYVRNLAERPGGERLKSQVESVFGQVGPVSTVYVRKAMRLRGQAFVVYEHEKDAQQAIATLNGTEVDGRIIEVAKAKIPSDAELGSENSSIISQRSQRRLEARTAKAARIDLNKGNNDSSLSNNVLFVENLSPEDAEKMNSVYTDLRGYLETRVVPARGVAFVEFQSPADAIAALEVPPAELPANARVFFAKK